MTSRSDPQALSDAATRVRKFLDERESGRGLSGEVAFFNGNPLNVADLETLLTAITALRTIAECSEPPCDHAAVARAALAASPSPDTDAGLDVGRLAEAMFYDDMGGEEFSWAASPRYHQNFYRRKAGRLLAEYARLTSEKGQPDAE